LLNWRKRSRACVSGWVRKRDDYDSGPWLLLYATVRNEGSPDGYARLASLLAYSLAPAALGLLAAIVWSFTAVKGAAR